MELLNLPLGVFRLILEESARTTGLLNAVELRLVCNPNATRITPGCGILQEYLYRLTLNDNSNQIDLSTAIKSAVKCLVAHNGSPFQNVEEKYTRSLCRAAVAHLRGRIFDYIRQDSSIKELAIYNYGFDDPNLHLLAAATYLGCEQTCADLLGIDPIEYNESIYFGNPLNISARRGHYKIMKRFMERKTSAYNFKFEQAMRVAAAAGHESIIQLLLRPNCITELSAETWSRLFLAATGGGNLDLVNFFLSPIQNGEIKTTLWSMRDLKYLAMKEAARFGHEKILRLLLDSGGDPNSAQNDWSPLCVAVLKGHGNIVKLLIERGADIEPRGYPGPPLYLAAKRGYKGIAQILLDNGADINGDKILTPVNAAACYGKVEMFLFFLNLGASTGCLRKGRGQQILYINAIRGHEAMIRVLIHNGLNIEECGEAAVLEAMKNGFGDAIKLLHKMGARSVPRRVAEAALFDAVRKRTQSTIWNLIAQGVNVKAICPETGCTALSLAKRLNIFHYIGITRLTYQGKLGAKQVG